MAQTHLGRPTDPVPAPAVPAPAVPAPAVPAPAVPAPAVPAPAVPAPAVPGGIQHVIALGASAGGLAALSVILAALPADFPAPILVVQHLSPDFPSHMADILARRTPLRVREAREDDRLRAGWVYIAPPAKHLLVRADGTLSLSDTPKVHSVRPSADVLFISLALGFGPCTVGVVLTGGDGDGADGIRAIREAGGVTIAQDQPSSEHPSMPRAAAETGDVDFVLPLAGIAAKLIALMQDDYAKGETDQKEARD